MAIPTRRKCLLHSLPGDRTEDCNVIDKIYYRRDCRSRYMDTTWRLILTLLVLLVSSLSLLAEGFNLDTSSPIQFSQPSSSYFGYSVLFHENRAGKWLLVGAPKAASDAQPTLRQPGAIYKCNPSRSGSRRCSQLILDNAGNERSAPGERPLVEDSKDNQWLGVSLARQPGANGKVVACGHLWANDYYSDAILPNGVCYTVNNNLERSTVVRERPCLHEVQIKADSNGKGIAWHGWCQAGFSAEYSMDGQTLLLGAVGSIAWRGTVISLSETTQGPGTPSPVADTTTWFPAGDEDESYIGYSVSSGYFTSQTEVQGVTGAPRAYEHGRVYIYNLRDFSLYTEIHGHGMSSYFGARVLGMDLNNDDWTDLLVGAPLYTEDQDEGCVYIYRNEGQGVMIFQGQLKGSKAPKARFGSSIENVGDLNMDGYEDVAVGAPFEDGMEGAVYIYHGTPDGLRTSHTQRITPSSFGARPNMFSTFGHSITGGMDVDSNGYPDIAVGSYENGRVSLFLSRSVIEMETRLDFVKSPINVKNTDCIVAGQKVACVKSILCFRYLGNAVPPSVPIDYTIETDWYKRQKGELTRLEFVQKNGVKIGPVLKGTLDLTATSQRCIVTESPINTDMKDFLSPIAFKVNYTLRSSDSYYRPPVLDCGDICPIFSMYSPNNFEELISFIHNCGNDSMCETDLQLKASTHIPRGTKYLPVGMEDHFFINIEVYNNGEEAHQAKVKIGHSDEISFVNVRSDNTQETLVLCTPEKTENETYIMCDVDNPMPSFKKSKFTVKVGVRSLHPDTEFLDIFVEAMTSSMEHNTTLNDNTRILSVPTKIEADITVRGVARPENLIYDTADKKTKSIENTGQFDIQPGNNLNPSNEVPISMESKTISTSEIGPSFQHVYDVRNLGPSGLPLHSTINISFPWRTREGKMLTYIEEIRVTDGYVSCNHEVVTDQQDGLLDIDFWNASNAEPEPQSSSSSRNPYSYALDTLSCDYVECINFTCTLGSLTLGAGGVIEVEARLWQPTFKDVWGDHKGYMVLVSKAQLNIDNPSKRHVQPSNQLRDFDEVSTLLFTEAAVQPKSVSKWLIAVGIIFGLLCLLALVLIMWKVGFFKRPMREEMERLIQEKDEMENFNPEGFNGENGFDQDFY